MSAQDAMMTENVVAHVGVIDPSAVGIRFAGDRNEVSHNEVIDTPYCGLAGHWGKGVRVEYNRISDVMQVFEDGAAIYVFYLEDLVMRGNVTHSSRVSVGLRAAYYLDEYCLNCDVAENLAVGVGMPSHNHMCQKNRIWGNVFIVDGDAVLAFARASGFAMTKNVVYAKGKIALRGINAVTHFERNVFYSATGEVVGVDLTPYTLGEPVVPLVAGEERTLTSNEGTLLADPMFVDVERGDYGFKPGSPALELGIVPIDVSRAGRTER